MSDENTQDDKHITKAVDKVVMGLIIGGAVGSVLGMAFAPKSGKETRKVIKQKAEEIGGKMVEIKNDFMHEHGEDVEEAKEIVVKKSKGIFGFLQEKLMGQKAVKKQGNKLTKKIPSEQRS